jgi:hypothetical protein
MLALAALSQRSVLHRDRGFCADSGSGLLRQAPTELGEGPRAVMNPGIDVSSIRTRHVRQFVLVTCLQLVPATYRQLVPVAEPNRPNKNDTLIRLFK